MLIVAACEDRGQSSKVGLDCFLFFGKTFVNFLCFFYLRNNHCRSHASKCHIIGHSEEISTVCPTAGRLPASDTMLLSIIMAILQNCIKAYAIILNYYGKLSQYTACLYSLKLYSLKLYTWHDIQVA